MIIKKRLGQNSAQYFRWNQAQNHVYQGFAPDFLYNSSNKGKEKDVEWPLNVYGFCLERTEPNNV